MTTFNNIEELAKDIMSALSGEKYSRINKDDVVLITAGAIDSYRPILLCKANMDFNIHDIMNQYLQEYPEQKEECEFEWYQFIDWLLKSKIVTQLQCKEWHLGEYGTPSPKIKPMQEW